MGRLAGRVPLRGARPAAGGPASEHEPACEGQRNVVFRHNRGTDWGGPARASAFEPGRVARQADGAAPPPPRRTSGVRDGGGEPERHVMNYQEKALRRPAESRAASSARGAPVEKETLTSRLIEPPNPAALPRRLPERDAVSLHGACLRRRDRPNPQVGRPRPPGASAASISSGPSPAPRRCYLDGEFILDPDPRQTRASDLDLVVARATPWSSPRPDGDPRP